MAWPITVQGIAVGNVASFGFFLYTLGFRVGAALVLSGMFKVYALIPSLWLIRERHWRQLVIGVAILGVLAVGSIPIVGLSTWAAWPTGLIAFQESMTRFPAMVSNALVRGTGEAWAVALTLIAIGFALFGRGRNSLARFGLASVVGSPTLYLHGLSPLVVGALVLGPEVLWFFFGLGPWYLGFGPDTGWIAMAVVGLALVVARNRDLRPPGDLSAARADLHPLNQAGQVWPEAG